MYFTQAADFMQLPGLLFSCRCAVPRPANDYAGSNSRGAKHGG